MNARFDIRATPLNGLSLLQRQRLGDERGYLERMFCTEDLQPLLQGRQIAQINRTVTRKRGTVRGLHFQYHPYEEAKFVSCLGGEVFDVAVDLRRGSPTFLHWHAERLSADNDKTLFIPEGFAHGFQALTDDCELLYFHTTHYAPQAEAGLHARDMRIGIAWPLRIAAQSPRDATHAMLDADFAGIDVAS